MDINEEVKRVKNKRWDEDYFMQLRQPTLAQWPTGKEVDLQEAVEYHKSMPAHKNMVNVLEQGIAGKRTLVQPRAGVALIDEHIGILKCLQNDGDADILPTTIDAYSRTQRYAEAQKGIETSQKKGRSMLNGVPLVNHGVKETRRIVEAVDRPLVVRTGTSDARLLAEVTLAAGYTDFLGGGIDYNVPYTKNIPLELTLFAWQYVDRLVAWYHEQGVCFNREQYGALSGTLLPPGIVAAVSVLEGLLAAEQGVKYYGMGYPQGGNLIQDVAAMHVMPQICKEYMDRFGYNDVTVTTVFHEWMGAFPPDEAQADGVIGYGAAAAALSGATQLISKTTHEAIGIPTKEANAAGVRTVKQVIKMIGEQRYPETNEVKFEMGIIRREAKAIIDRVLEMGDGDVAQGIIRGFAAGILDIPFSPSINNANKALPVRDNDGMLRWMDAGNLPLDKDMLEFNREKVALRAAFEGRDPNYEMTVDDVFAVNRGSLIGRPGMEE